ncbi:AsmA-like C-terminal region-containing protein [Lewinella sp. JB7]|uniref:AsmA-like C-terminal region-containing protein n=1 Tax=Lewinella sp. JB7 TaxID=2962887 RepID=UPI0020C9F56C|nr:AsmA-like C-terminal region-containing protein [Lewinella sp. JB7]MCP9237854.1 AsmA-like C-terminal region-containing protein [Lewinella sp. JB7]
MRPAKIIGTIFLVLLLPFVVVELFGGPIARRVVEALNGRLQTEIVIGSFDLSLLRAFPHLSVDLRDVTVAGSDGSRLLEAEHVACLVDLGSLFGKVRVSGILVEDGKLQLFTDPDGNTNYQLTGYTSVGDRAEGGGAGAEGVEFAAERARLRNVALVYQDAQLGVDALLTVDQAAFSGDFGRQSYLLETHAEIRIAYVDQNGQRYLDNETLTVEGTTAVDHTLGGYEFRPLRLIAGELELEATGFLTPTEDGLTTALEINSTSGSLADVLAFVPPAYASTLAELETSGELSLTASVNGAWTERTYPRFDGRLAFTDGRLESPRMNVGARAIDLAATFAYVNGPAGGVQTFVIERFTGTFRVEPFDLRLRMEDLDDPRITFGANGSLPLATLPALLGDGPISQGQGLIHFRGVSVQGRYRDMVDPRRAGRIATAGTVRVADGMLTVHGREISLPTGTLVLEDNALQLTDLALQMEETDVVLNGRATNLIPVLFSDSLNSRDAALDFSATLSGRRFDIGEVLALSGPGEDENGSAVSAGGGPAPPVRLTDLLDGRFEASVDGWRWDNMNGSDFRGQLIFTPGQLTVRGVTEAMDGGFRLDATAYFRETNRVDARITATGVDAEQFFDQSDNFDQTFLTADHLEGTLNARILLEVPFDTLGDVDYDRLHVLAGLEILDGELHDFEMLENFAFALKSGDLERVRFTRLANYVEITDRTVYIPAMSIRSSAINLTLSGRHTFDQELEYYVKVNAGQVITNKIRRHDDALEVLPARNGLFNLYYTIRGPLESYAVENDKRAVKNDFIRSDARRSRIKEALDLRFQQPIELLPPPEDDDLTEQ